ncbi:MAG TPA: GGDEF domain-containing protein [Vicinamibacterales bacterium]|nr:GGDEF domain-containing protein [Vicinamibacterales bacterium]
MIWAAGWLLLAPAMLLAAATYNTPSATGLAAGTCQLLGIATAVLFLWSGDVFRQTRLMQFSRLRLLSIFALWFLLAPFAFGQAAVNGPGYVVIAVAYAGAGSMYAAVLLERRMIGAGLLAFVLFGLAISNVTSAFVRQPVIGGGPFAMEILAVNAVLYALGAFGMHLVVFEDMTLELRIANRRLESAREELQQAAITDPLTGCHNRRFLEEVTDRELKRHARFSLPLSLLFIDVDCFKAVNDTLGHDAGDRVLQFVAKFLKRNIREADYVFRYGGDEFLVLITCKGEEARRKAARLKTLFADAPEAGSMPPGLGLSVGWIEVTHGATELAPFLVQVDKNMYAEKRRHHEIAD